MSRALSFAAALLLLTPAVALADEPAPEPAVEPAVEPTIEEKAPAGESLAYTDIGTVGSVRSYSSSWLIMPDGWEMSGELRFLTADAPPGGIDMKMTDVVVTRLNARTSVKGKAEIAGGIDALPKQPSYTDEFELQGADLSARVGFKKKYAAYLAAAGGPLSADQGWWQSTGLGVQRRSIVHDTLSFQLGLGGSMTPMFFDEDAGGHTAWLGEVVARGQTLFMAEDMFGIWLGADFAFPVAHSGEMVGGAEFDPQTRVDVGIGAVYSVVDDWDVYIQYSIVDRGDMTAPETQLPILLGGSDQRVLTFGLTRHFGGEDYGDDDMYLAY